MSPKFYLQIAYLIYLSPHFLIQPLELLNINELEVKVFIFLAFTLNKALYHRLVSKNCELLVQIRPLLLRYFKFMKSRMHVFHDAEIEKCKEDMCRDTPDEFIERIFVHLTVKIVQENLTKVNFIC